MDSTNLSNKVALVTGASGGIGSVIAKTIASAGAFVVLGYHRNKKGALETQAQIGERALCLQGDVSNAEVCQRVVEAARDKCGRIDILVNNAAIEIFDSFGTSYETWQSLWNTTLNVNLMGAVNMTFCCVPHMKGQGSGKIINISSRSAFRGETEYMAYAASKAALVNFTRCTARALAKDNIGVYAVAPGFIDAGMGRGGIAQHEAEIRDQIPSGKIGTPQDVANVVLFLASGLSDYITGSTIDVNGGSYLH